MALDSGGRGANVTAYAWPDGDGARVHIRSQWQRIIGHNQDGTPIYRSVSVCGLVILEDRNAEPHDVLAPVCKRCKAIDRRRT